MVIRDIAHKWAEGFAGKEIEKFADLVVNNILPSAEVEKIVDVSSGLVDVPVGFSKGGSTVRSFSM